MRRITAMLFVCLLTLGQVWAQTRTVTGRVTDDGGVPLPGVTVSGVGVSNINTTTDANGNFSLNVPNAVRALEFSYVGFDNLRLNIGQGVMNITLAPSSAALDEVVVTGYSNIKRSQFVGAAAKVDKKAMELVPVGSFENMLQGRAPGLRITSGSGQPGAAAAVQIRGPNSISGGSGPLYIMDGVPVEASVFQSYNPNDFESVDVIKDASAAALYGSRGAAGVIVVTTKRGKAGKAVLTYRGQAGITQPGTQKFNMMNTQELFQFQEELGKFIPTLNLPGWTTSPNNPAFQNASAAQQGVLTRQRDSLSGIDVNWRDVFQGSGNFMSHDLNLSGGTDRTTYFASFGLYDEQGIGLRSDMKRYTFRLNLDHKTDKFSFGIQTLTGFTKRNFIESENAVALANPFAAAYLALPYNRLYNDDGTVAAAPGRVGPNAIDRLENSLRYNNQLKNTTNVLAEYKITKNVYLGGNAGIDFRETQNTFWLNPASFTASTSAFPTSTGAYSEDLSRFFQSNVRGYIGYRNTFADRHNVDVNMNGEYIYRFQNTLGFTGFGINQRLPNTPAAITPGTVDNRLIPGVRGSKTERSYSSAFLNLKYNYDLKYFIDFTARYDGVSILPEQNRFQNFYAVGFLWNVLREDFASKWRMFDELRFRASYGSSANAENFPFGNFGYFPLYGQGSYAGFPTLVPTSPGNPQGDWEYTDKLNIGIDFRMFNSRLSGDLNLYNEVTRNLFIAQQLPPENGGAFTSAQVNAGSMRNQGVELQLSYDVIRNRNLRWSVGGNFGYNKNEITDLGQESEYPAGTAIVRVGLPLGSHFVVPWAGVDAATGAPLYRERDGKTTTRFNTADMSVAEFGTFYAPWNGGFNSDLSYKGFSINAFFNFQQGFSRFNNQDFFQLNHAFAQQGFNMRREMSSMWKQAGDVTDIQSPLFQRQFSSKDVQDASYLRFRNLLISYQLPSTLLSRTKHISSVRIYTQAQNLYTWTKWSGFDPEDNNNIAAYEYPLPRTFTFGIDVSF